MDRTPITGTPACRALAASGHAAAAPRLVTNSRRLMTEAPVPTSLILAEHVTTPTAPGHRPPCDRLTALTARPPAGARGRVGRGEGGRQRALSQCFPDVRRALEYHPPNRRCEASWRRQGRGSPSTSRCSSTPWTA